MQQLAQQIQTYNLSKRHAIAGPDVPDSANNTPSNPYELPPLKNLNNTKGVDTLENLLDIKEHNV